MTTLPKTATPEITPAQNQITTTMMKTSPGNTTALSKTTEIEEITPAQELITTEIEDEKLVLFNRVEEFMLRQAHRHDEAMLQQERRYQALSTMQNNFMFNYMEKLGPVYSQ